MMHALYLKYLRSGHHRGKNTLLSLWKRALCLGDILALTNSGILMNLNSNDFVQEKILRYGSYETNTLSLLRQILKEGNNFIDVGGHVGQFSLEAAQIVGKKGRVVTVEPNPRNFNYLLNNININKFTTIVPILCAASNIQGIIGMKLPSDDNWGASREASYGEHIDYYALAERLDELLANIGIFHVDVVKIDVEGLEYRVLEGLCDNGDFLPKHILFEFIPTYIENASKAAHYLQSKGYELLTVIGEPFDIKNYSVLNEDNLWARLKD
jgi:FkbM family methyltransferase